VRSDMAKVLCEEPRHGMRTKYRKGSLREDKRVPMDEKPVKEAGNLRRNWLGDYSHKEFGDHVQPLRRFVLSCVGRKWDDVYSEIRKTIPKGSVVNNHLYTHLFEYVATNVYINDGVPYDTHYSGWRGKQGLSVYQDTYVHPDTGILCKTPKRPYRGRHKNNLNYIGIDENTAYYRKDGIWYICKFRGFPEKGESYGYDMMYHEHWRIYYYESRIRNFPISRDNRSMVKHHFTNYYGKPVYCYQKQQISKKEIKKLRATPV
jgi:hypothetical protein